MGVNFSNAAIKWIHHGGALDFRTLMSQVIDITITFPHTGTEGGWTCSPVTVNLGTDVGVSSNNRVYAVDWLGTDEKTTVQDSMSPFRHQCTFILDGPQKTFTKTYRITLYGDPLLQHDDFTYALGDGNTGYKVTSHQVSLNHPEVSKSRSLKDKTIPLGARIAKVFYGNKIVFGKIFAGSTYTFKIRLTNAGTPVKLVNPLTVECNDWNDLKTDMKIDWGDGHVDTIINRYINTGLHNTSSNVVPSHTYKGTTGNEFIITITSVEPVFPIGASLLEIDGVLPEDKYTGNQEGLLSYSSSDRNEWRDQLSQQKETINKLGPNICDNWVRSTKMVKTFSGFNAVTTIPNEFFKANILNVCTHYISTFANMRSLRNVDPLLFGSENNTVTHMVETFIDTSVNTVVDLDRSSSLISVDRMYKRTHITTTNKFLLNATALQTCVETFAGSHIATHNASMMINSLKLTSVQGIFMSTVMSRHILDLKRYPLLSNLSSMYEGCKKLTGIPADLFGGVFGRDVTKASINISRMFTHVGEANVLYTTIHPNVFKPLVSISGKLANTVTSLFEGSCIEKIPDALFNDVFVSDTPRFELTAMFKDIKIKAENTRDKAGEYIPISLIFRNCNGVVSLKHTFENVKIDYISSDIFRDMTGLSDVTSIFQGAYFHNRCADRLFVHNTKISNWNSAFKQATFIYNEIPLDRIIHSDSETVDITDMLNTANDIVVYKLFKRDSATKNVTANSTWIRNKQSAPPSFIFDGKKTSLDETYDIRPLIYDLYIDSDNTAITITFNTAISSAHISYDIDTPYVEVGAGTSITHVYNKGHHRLSVKSNSDITVTGDHAHVIRIHGEIPYNASPNLDWDKAKIYTPRELGRNLFSVCHRHELSDDSCTLEYIPIVHKNIFMYYDHPNSIRFFNRSRLHTGVVGMYGIQPRMTSGIHQMIAISAVAKTLTPFHNIKSIGYEAQGTINFTGNLNKLRDVYVDKACVLRVNTDSDIIGSDTCLAIPNYLEFKLEGYTGNIQLTQLVDNTVFPITVEIYYQDDANTTSHQVNSFNDNISINHDVAFVRVYSQSPVWINQKDKITELYGSIPRCNFSFHMSDLAPNLRLVGEDLLIYLTNTSVKGLFKNCRKLEYVPGTIFWYNPNITDFSQCFMGCTAMFKVDDYIITDKVTTIDCTDMFRDSGVVDVKFPIADDITGRVVISNMFAGCRTSHFYKHVDLDKAVFRNIDTIGNSGLKRNTDVTIMSDFDHLYIESDASNTAGLQISYVVPTTVVSNIRTIEGFKYLSQSIQGQVLPMNRAVITAEMTRYIPFIYKEIPNGQGAMVKGVYDHVPYINHVSTPITTLINSRWLHRNHRIANLSHLYTGSKSSGSPIDISMLFPTECYNLTIIDSMFDNSNGIVCRSDYQLPPHIIFGFSAAFREAHTNISVDFFKNLQPDRVYTGFAWGESLFDSNTSQTSVINVLKTYGEILQPTRAKYMYTHCTSLVNMDVNMFSNSSHLTSLEGIFKGCVKLVQLPKINNMTGLNNTTHAFASTAIESLPENYIHTTAPSCDMSYMFADCPALYIENTFIDARSTANFTIDHSLNDVISAIGDDPEIFGHVTYDTEYERRSRVVPFDKKVAWYQDIKTNGDNKTIVVTSLQKANLVGHTADRIMSIVWGDGSRPVIIRAGQPIRSEDITHTYKTAGNYTFQIMAFGVTPYIETLSDEVHTIGLPTSFKFGSIDEIRTKGLKNMFGSKVQTISADLFTKLTGIDSASVYKNMFDGFKSLTTLPDGILDCMPALTNIDNFLINSKADSTEFTLGANLFKRLAHVQSMTSAFENSNLRTIEHHAFDGLGTSLTDIRKCFKSSKLQSIPVDLFKLNTGLLHIDELLNDVVSFNLDNSYADIFKYNIGLQTADFVFMGCKISSIPATILAANTKLTSINGMFASNSSYSVVDDNNAWDIPSGLLATNTILVSAHHLFAGRRSCRSYPEHFLDATKNTLSNVSFMFADTSITKIHEGTLTGKTINVDATFMFHHCYVRNCPKVITSSTGTIKTTSMLKGVSGYMTENELFTGINTDPSNIQSEYRREVHRFIVEFDATEVKDMHLVNIDTSLFPWVNHITEIIHNGQTILIRDDINDQDTLARLTTFKCIKGHNVVEIGARSISELKYNDGSDVMYSKLSGSLGYQKASLHIPFNTTGFGKVSPIIIESDTFYRYNTHITDMSNAFANTKVKYLSTNIFAGLNKVKYIVSLFERCEEFRIKDGFKPSFDHMTELSRVTNVFCYCHNLVINKDYEPFMNISTITDATNAFAETAIIVTPRINTKSIISAQGIYYKCRSLTTTYADIFDGMNKCINAHGAFGHCNQLSVIEGENDDKSILSNMIPESSVSEINIFQMFKNTKLTYQQIVRIVNNMGIWKAPHKITVTLSHMFDGTNVSGQSYGTRPLQIVSENKVLITNDMFNECYLTNINSSAIKLTGDSQMTTFDNMFGSCFASPDVQFIDQVFSISGNPESTDYRSTNLDTLNVFNITIDTPHDSVIKMKFVGDSSITQARYVYVGIGSTPAQQFLNTNITDIVSKEFSVPAGTTSLVIHSSPLILPILHSGDMAISGVACHLGTHQDNYVNWSDQFDFGTYFGEAKTFTIRLGGQFHVRDGGFHTLNGLFRGMKYITSYPRDLFIDYKGGTDGTQKIVGLISTFENNKSLESIDIGMLQYIPYVESIKRGWAGTNIRTINPNTFASCENIRDTSEAFKNTPIVNVPSRLVAIRK